MKGRKRKQGHKADLTTQQSGGPGKEDSEVIGNNNSKTSGEGKKFRQNVRKSDKGLETRKDNAEESPKPGSSKSSGNNNRALGSATLKKPTVTTSKGRTVVVEYRDLVEQGGSFGTNQAVLRQLFQLYPPCFSDLVNIRRVCKAWNNSSLDSWRAEAILKLIPENTVFRNADGGVRTTEFLNFLEDAMDPLQLKEIPYTKFRFQGLKIDMSISDEGESQKFWQLVGCNMKYLHLNACEFVGVFENPLQCLLLEKTPKLEEIVVTDIKKKKLPFGQVPQWVSLKKWKNLSVKRVTVHGRIPLDFETFLMRFPNIKELTLQSNGDVSYSSSLVKVLKELRFNPRSKKYCLEKLVIKDRCMNIATAFYVYKDLTSQELNHLGLSLKTLCLEQEPGILANLILQSLLKSNRNIETLEFCVVPRDPVPFYANQRFYLQIQMDSLTDLRLWGSVIKNLKFLKYMPSLRRLYINPLCFEKWSGSGKHLQRYTEDLVRVSELAGSFKLSSMEYLHVEHKLGGLSVQKLGKWMPNLKVLKTILSVKTFPIVCQQWPNLRNLGLLFGSRVNDETIIGSRPISPPARVTRRSKQKGDGCRAGILNLKNLNVFSLDAYCDEAQLSDISANEAFLKMSSLVTLQIYVSERMSAETEDSLKRKIPCVRIIRNNGPHDYSECCIRREFLIRCNASGDEERRFQEEEALLDRDSDIDLGDEVEEFRLDENEDDA